jgi:hypothetical protein
LGILDAIARNAVTELPVLGDTRDAKPWQAWLDLMRESRWGFEVTGNVACTEREWDAGVEDGRPLIQVRREQHYTTGDEWKKIYVRNEVGKLRRLSARELKGKSSDDLRKYFHWLEDGTIEHVFVTSARFCEDLASRAFALDAASGRTESDSRAAVGVEARRPIHDGETSQVAGGLGRALDSRLGGARGVSASATPIDDSARKGSGPNLDSGPPTSRPMPPKRTQDLDTSRRRLALVNILARELAILKQDLAGYCTPEGLKRKYPNFTLWTLIEDSQIKELMDGKAFTPKAYAENLTLAKSGLTSRETLKKDRRKLREAAKSARRRQKPEVSPSVPSKL